MQIYLARLKICSIDGINNNLMIRKQTDLHRLGSLQLDNLIVRETKIGEELKGKRRELFNWYLSVSLFTGLATSCPLPVECDQFLIFCLELELNSFSPSLSLCPIIHSQSISTSPQNSICWFMSLDWDPQPSEKYNQRPYHVKPQKSD